METLCSFKIHEYEMDHFASDRMYFRYRVETPEFEGMNGDRKTVFFEGKDFSPSPFDDLECEAAKLQLLFFLSSDEIDYSNYTEEQMEWIASQECQDIELDIEEMENK